MRKHSIYSASFLLALSLLPAARTQAQNPLEGGWKGPLRVPSGQMVCTAIFSLAGGVYTGSITSFQGNVMIPFSEVIVDGEKVSATFNINTVEGMKPVKIAFQLSGDVLIGTGELTIGEKSTPLNYELARMSEIDLDYEKIASERDPTLKKQHIDTFVSKHPDSQLVGYAYEQGAYLGRQTGNLDMMSEYGEKSLALRPDNYVLMTELGNAYVQRENVEKAEAHALRALELVQDAAVPDQASPEQWEQGKRSLMAMNFSTLGFVHLHRAQGFDAQPDKRREAQQAVAPFKKALEYNPGDDFSYYGLGFASAILNDYANAESNLAKAVVLNGPIAANARGLLEDIYRASHKDSLEGLEAVMAKARSELGIP